MWEKKTRLLEFQEAAFAEPKKRDIKQQYTITHNKIKKVINTQMIKNENEYDSEPFTH